MTNEPHKPPVPLWKVIGGVVAIACLIGVLASLGHGSAAAPTPTPTPTVSAVAASPTTMPDVSGQTVSAATATLHAEFPSAQVTVEGSGAPDDLVGSTVPAVGSSTLGWSTIYLYPASTPTTTPPAPAATDATTDSGSSGSDNSSGGGSDPYIPHPHVHACVGGKHVHVCS